MTAAPGGLAACAARILIVSPQPSQVAQLERLLRGAGYTQVCSQWRDPPGRTGVAWDQPLFDLVLLHLRLPDLQGFEAVAPLMHDQSVEQAPPVLAITTGTGEPWRALQAGARDCLRAPFEALELLTRMRHLLDARLAHRLLVQRLHALERQLQHPLAWPSHPAHTAHPVRESRDSCDSRAPRTLPALLSGRVPSAANTFTPTASPPPVGLVAEPAAAAPVPALAASALTLAPVSASATAMATGPSGLPLRA